MSPPSPPAVQGTPPPADPDPLSSLSQAPPSPVASLAESDSSMIHAMPLEKRLKMMGYNFGPLPPPGATVADRSLNSTPSILYDGGWKPKLEWGQGDDKAHVPRAHVVSQYRDGAGPGPHGPLDNLPPARQHRTKTVTYPLEHIDPDGSRMAALYPGQVIPTVWQANYSDEEEGEPVEGEAAAGGQAVGDGDGATGGKATGSGPSNKISPLSPAARLPKVRKGVAKEKRKTRESRRKGTAPPSKRSRRDESAGDTQHEEE